jgi:hypothetical protein
MTEPTAAKVKSLLFAKARMVPGSYKTQLLRNGSKYILATPLKSTRYFIGVQ